nr:hypothetical protein [Micromonospora provocatoris]
MIRWNTTTQPIGMRASPTITPSSRVRARPITLRGPVREQSSAAVPVTMPTANRPATSGVWGRPSPPRRSVVHTARPSAARAMVAASSSQNRRSTAGCRRAARAQSTAAQLDTAIAPRSLTSAAPGSRAASQAISPSTTAAAATSPTRPTSG